MKRALVLITFLLQYVFAEAQSKVSFYVFAHPDDWQIFMGVDAYNEISSDNTKVVLIQIGAGEGSLGTGGATTFKGKTYLPYYLSRLSGSKKAVQFCGDVNSLHSYWSSSVTFIAGHNIRKETYKNVVMYTLLLSDTDDIRFLYDKSEEAKAIDGSTTYRNREDLIETLKEIFLAEGKGFSKKALRTTDPDNLCYNVGDHKDHVASSSFAIGANKQLYTETGELMTTYAYLAYSSKKLPVNLTTEQLAIKGALFGLTDWGRTENNHRSVMEMDNTDDSHIKWACRQYKRKFNYLIPIGDCSKAKQPNDNTWLLSESDEDDEESDIMVQPNPASSFISLLFRVSSSGTTQIDLYDISGRPIVNIMNEEKNAGNYAIRYDIQNLPANTYIIKLKSPSGDSSFKFIKQ